MNLDAFTLDALVKSKVDSNRTDYRVVVSETSVGLAELSIFRVWYKDDEILFFLPSAFNLTTRTQAALLEQINSANSAYMLPHLWLKDNKTLVEFNAADHLPYAECVFAINQWQEAGFVPPLTCGNDSNHKLLVADIKTHRESECTTHTVGLKCVDCDYTQEYVPDTVYQAYWDGSLQYQREDLISKGFKLP